ncbi:TonB-dependent receptor [Sulfurimonas sp. SAG-AH-194-C20]|nr:TonB-dependent receptor [Sulfurimonas sp. SAG-AH-194-C20]MDF1878241.1 TonB-dependent receptor [Sulfurimonas sp. SAG-AH-194-C20]
MPKTLILSLLTYASLQASEINLSTLNVESTLITEVAQNAQISADVAQALSDSVPSIDISRRSGIANDVLIRGQKRDNISVEIDGTKIQGACPNRMDPPVSHILANQIQSIEVIEGPYDVTNFGTLSGGLKIKTKKPTKETKAEINAGLGAFSYKKLGATVNGGNDTIRVLVTASTESSNQYRDGDGKTLTQQTKNKAPSGNQYKTEYENLEAYSKKSVNAKAFVSTLKNQELQLSVTANRSTNILYANSSMDALYDDSNIYSIAYDIKDLSQNFKNLNLQYYYSDVDHPMSTKYRNAADTPANDITNAMKSYMQGLKLKNDFTFSSHKVLLGLDASKREWQGEYLTTSTGAYRADSISETITNNMAIFTQVENSYGDFNVSVGLRYDNTGITNTGGLKDNNYQALNANIFSSYHLNTDNKLFFGLGQASRVPDARELYFLKSGNVVGTPNLKQTTNTEVDLGYESDNDDFKLRIKAFYSKLKDYIYIQAGETTNAFVNIDATVLGGEFSLSYYINDDITLDMDASYKEGTKDKALVGQTNKNLADMAPLRAKIALNYEYANNSLATLDFRTSDKWSKFDSDNGEQELAAWSIVNFKIKHAVNKKFDFTFGANNIFDATYVTSNTYADLTLVITGSNEVMLLNEPGRYLYANMDFKF